MDSKTAADRGIEPLGADERRFLFSLMDELRKTDRAVHDALLKTNPDLIEHDRESDIMRERIRAALTGQAGKPLSAQRKRLIERLRAVRVERYHQAGRTAALDRVEEPAGVLTSVTRQLSPEKAFEFYRKIAPVLVYQILSRLDQSCCLRIVREVVDHLCSEEVQASLRRSAHVRDGLLEELSRALGRSEIQREFSREDLQRLLVECGAMHDLVAMENCIKLTAARVG